MIFSNNSYLLVMTPFTVYLKIFLKSSIFKFKFLTGCEIRAKYYVNLVTEKVFGKRISKCKSRNVSFEKWRAVYPNVQFTKTHKLFDNFEISVSRKQKKVSTLKIEIMAAEIPVWDRTAS